MKRMVQLILVVLALVLVAGVVGAAPPVQEEESQTYVVKPGEGLIELAKKFLGDGDAYALIVAATNAMADKDASFLKISDPNIILVGQKLIIPGAVDLPVSAPAEADMDQDADAGTDADTATGESEATGEEAAESTDAAETPKLPTKALAGTSWLLTTFNDAGPLPQTTITLEFVDETSAAGSSGCNNYNTSYEIEGIRISFGQSAGTLKACPEPVMVQEQSYLQALADAAFYQVSDQRLRLFDSKTTMVAEFAPASSDLAGSSWDVIGYNNGKGGVVSVKIGTSITADFGEDGQVTGNASCNDYFGPYVADGNAISVGPLAATRKLCIDEEIMVQEGQYLAALETAATYKITGDKMEMRTESGSLVANFSRK